MASQLGTKIIDHFQDSGRGANAGKNDHGVEVEFLLVSVEEEAGFDRQVNARTQSYRFEGSAIDLGPGRENAIRAGFSYYRGVASTPEPSSLPFADRRRIVILNLVDGGPGPEYREILHNDLPQSSGALSAEDETEIKAAINSVQPAPPDSDEDGLTDDEETGITGTDPGLRDSDGDGTPDGLEDPDGDGQTNLDELRLYLTDPADGLSFFAIEVDTASGPHSLRIPTRTGRRYTIEQAGPPGSWGVHSSLSGTGQTEIVLIDSSGPEGHWYRVRVELE